MEELKIRIKTLTPLWTGGLDGTMDRIHETGLIGSLRWWYEAIVRGLGGNACDPTGENRCPDKNGNYCDVCQVFGATGLQRAFRLEGPVWWNRERRNRLSLKVNNNRGWFLRRGFMGEGDLKILTLRLPEVWDSEDLKQSLLLILKLIEKWAGLGARTQQGYGVVKLDSIALNFEKALSSFEKLKTHKKHRNIHSSEKISIEGFFFGKGRFSLSESPQKWMISYIASAPNSKEELDWYLNLSFESQKSLLPLSPIIRYHLRGLMRPQRANSGGYDREGRHVLMGELGRKSLIHVSHAYPVGDNQWEFRIWGWIPQTLRVNINRDVNRDTIFKDLKQWLGVQQERQWHIAKEGQLWKTVGISNPEICWFEKKPDESPAEYLRSLLEGCPDETKGGHDET